MSKRQKQAPLGVDLLFAAIAFVLTFSATLVGQRMLQSTASSPSPAGNTQTVQLDGAGASFSAILYERYFSELNRQFPDLQVSYQPVGSGAGIRQIIGETLDFAASDAAMTDEEIAQVDRGILLIPTSGGSVALVYNLPGVSDLKLSRSVYPAIFLGEITRWNDPRIAADNPGVNLPDLPIRNVVRSDGSGTTFIFTNHLSAISPDFDSSIGVSIIPRWTNNPIQARGNPGVAAQVSRTPGGIGYVEYAFAQQNNLPTALLENRSGEYVAPVLEEAEKALESVEFPEDFRVFVSDPETGYPITGLTWIIIYRQYEDAETAEAIKQMVEWIMTDGQALNNSLEYVDIPENVAERAVEITRREVTAP
jgi:phosphate transport system substrate-binding protein